MAEGITIPELPAQVGAVAKTQEFETVENGVSKKVNQLQITDYTRTAPVPVAVGGVNAGFLPTGNVADLLDKLLYDVAPTLAYNISPTLAEKGLTVTNVNHSAAITANGQTITNRRIIRNAAVVTAPTTNSVDFDEAVSLIFSSTNRDSTFAFDSPTGTVQINRTVNFAAPAYNGVGVAGLNQAQIKALTKTVKSNKNLTSNFSPTNQRYYYAWPQSQGAIISVLDPNGFQIIDSFTLTTANFLLADGITSEPMFILTSNNNTTQVNYQLQFS